jgi:hypothetical protein
MQLGLRYGIFSFPPIFRRKKFAGYGVKKPRIIPTCIMIYGLVFYNTFKESISAPPPCDLG